MSNEQGDPLAYLRADAPVAVRVLCGTPREHGKATICGTPVAEVIVAPEGRRIRHPGQSLWQSRPLPEADFRSQCSKCGGVVVELARVDAAVRRWEEKRQRTGATGAVPVRSAPATRNR